MHDAIFQHLCSHRLWPWLPDGSATENAIYVPVRMLAMMSSQGKLQCMQSVTMLIEEWFNFSETAAWRFDEGPTPFKQQRSPLCRVPGLERATSALVDPAHTWHIGLLSCILNFLFGVGPANLKTIIYRVLGPQPYRTHS